MARNQGPPQTVTSEAKFVAMLLAMREGKVSIELDTSFSDIVGAVMSTGKTGELNIKIKVAPVKGGDPNMMFVTDKISVTLPKLDKLATMFYAQDDLSLSRRDPRQPALEMTPGPVTRPALVGKITPADAVAETGN